MLLFFGLLRAVLKSRVMPTVSQTAGGKALLNLLRYGFVLALVVLVLGFALVFFREAQADPLLQWGALGGALLVCATASWAILRSHDQSFDVDQILRDYAAAKEAAATEKSAHQNLRETLVRLAEVQEGHAFRDAVVALIREAKDANARPGAERAIELLRQGETAGAEAMLAQILDERLRARATASNEIARATKEATQAARHLGAIAYLDNTAKAIEAYCTATELDPDDTWSWIYLGRLHKRVGSLAAAEQAFTKAREAARRIGDQRDLMVADISLADVRVARGDLAGAVDAYQTAVDAARYRAAQDPSHTEWQRDLSVSFNKIGDVQIARGDLAAALQAYQDGLAITQKLAAQHPSDTEWQRDLAYSWDRIGTTDLLHSNMADALEAYGTSHAIIQRLAAQDPSNAGLQMDLSDCYVTIANIHLAQADVAGRLGSYWRVLAILVMMSDYGHQQSQRDLVGAHTKLTEVVGDLDERAASAARPSYEKALTILRELEERQRLAPGDAWRLADLGARLERLGAGTTTP